MPNPVIDPQYVEAQQKYFAYENLGKVKNKTGMSTKKLLMIVVPVFALIIGGIILFGRTGNAYIAKVWYDGKLYRISDDTAYVLPDGFESIGELTHSEEPEKDKTELAAEFYCEQAEAFVRPGDGKFMYIKCDSMPYYYVGKG